jgi:hypothetical protein
MMMWVESLAFFSTIVDMQGLCPLGRVGPQRHHDFWCKVARLVHGEGIVWSKSRLDVKDFVVALYCTKYKDPGMCVLVGSRSPVT